MPHFATVRCYLNAVKNRPVNIPHLPSKNLKEPWEVFGELEGIWNASYQLGLREAVCRMRGGSQSPLYFVIIMNNSTSNFGIRQCFKKLLENMDKICRIKNIRADLTENDRRSRSNY